MIKTMVLSLILMAATTVSSISQEWEFSTDVGGYAITGLGGTENGEAWAVMGGSLSLGQVFYYDGSAWSLQTALYNIQTGEHRGLCVSRSGNWGYLVGNSISPVHGNIFRYDGNSWAFQTALVGGSSYLYSVCAPDEYTVWAGGNAGNIYYSSNGGTTWGIQTTVGPGNYIWSISGYNSNNVWAVGSPGAVTGPSTIFHYNGSTWNVQTTIPARLYSISAAREDSCWASGYDGLILKYDGAKWICSTDIGNPIVNSVAAETEGEKVWAGLSNGEIMHYNGASWMVETQVPQDVEEVIVSTAGEVWAGARFGLIYRRQIQLPQRKIYDYNGDGTSDIAVFRDTTGLWAIRGITRVYFGASADIPAPGDYNGDSTTEITIFRPPIGLWAILGMTRVYFGASGDYPIQADYTGNGTYEEAIFRSSTGLWAIRGVTRAYFGISGDIPIPANYFGEGKANIAIFRPTNGLWAARSFTRAYFGQLGDIPVPAIYEGIDWIPAIFRPSSGLWALMQGTRYYFGQSIDIPVPAHYDGRNVDRIGIFRRTNGLWAVRNITRVYYGGTGDIPVTR